MSSKHLKIDIFLLKDNGLVGLGFNSFMNIPTSPRCTIKLGAAYYFWIVGKDEPRGWFSSRRLGTMNFRNEDLEKVTDSLPEAVRGHLFTAAEVFSKSFPWSRETRKVAKQRRYPVTVRILVGDRVRNSWRMVWKESTCKQEN